MRREGNSLKNISFYVIVVYERNLLTWQYFIQVKSISLASLWVVSQHGDCILFKQSYFSDMGKNKIDKLFASDFDIHPSGVSWQYSIFSASESG